MPTTTCTRARHCSRAARVDDLRHATKQEIASVEILSGSEPYHRLSRRQNFIQRSRENTAQQAHLISPGPRPQLAAAPRARVWRVHLMPREVIIAKLN
ncbi:BQ5605_C019g08851 [Microbotryum silenes-dioicae]|uniref:BQ5605_C019g08851 protein n=1 Tax=Microbotryum silenes-dioicae TaxID=796604 RepID=A0A2X0MQR9_9BASI|nr:BQ5605_C019g08851 [Microbotryum silenes-dioicae]